MLIMFTRSTVLTVNAFSVELPLPKAVLKDAVNTLNTACLNILTTI